MQKLKKTLQQTTFMTLWKKKFTAFDLVDKKYIK